MSGQPRAYVTYFDQRYLARALVMLRSLRHHDPAAEIFPLCFDRVAFEVIAGLADAMITPIGAEEIGAFEPRLGECGERGRWEFYATHKPVLPLYVFDRRPEIGAIAHIDADTFFYASPQPLFDEIGAASLALSPHHKTPDVARAASDIIKFHPIDCESSKARLVELMGASVFSYNPGIIEGTLRQIERPAGHTRKLVRH